MEAIIADVIAKTPSAIATVEGELPEGFPARVFDAVTTGLKKAVTQL
jgi:serine/threonine-protein kinase HipA